ncbi:VanZ family protein [Clostridium manihotivorum]|uniref:VanZ family protein n=1 Tax=Clostridium manihotivorum TaxID=2320868 RepID=A0A410DT35_9CLOT|nr:VanZ family protein [Clostridium manihotivorum]QAA32215.1 VanZ family protein [Clostridium manihotivorum]
MLLNYVKEGFSFFIKSVPIAFIIFMFITCLKWIIKRKLEFKPITMFCEFAWILNVYAILRITGIIGMDFRVTEVLNGHIHYSIKPFEDGLSAAMVLNLLLFAPFGFFTPIVFKKMQSKWLFNLIIAVLFSGSIEFLQIFSGRYAQIDDILMNTLGSLLGYALYVLSLKLKSQFKPQKSSIHNN